MKKIYVALIATLLLFSGCTHNNGDIGPIFGSWSLVGISENGTPLALDNETVFSFQNEIVQVVKLGQLQERDAYRYGNFSMSDKKLTLKFQSKPTANGSMLYMTPTWLYFPQDGMPIHFDVIKLGGGKMVWNLETESGTYTYTFEKTW